MQEPRSIEKVAEVDRHIGVAMSGLTADARTLVDHARVECQVWLQSLSNLFSLPPGLDGNSQPSLIKPFETILNSIARFHQAAD